MMTPLRCEGRGGDQERVMLWVVNEKMPLWGGPLGAAYVLSHHTQFKSTHIYYTVYYTTNSSGCPADSDEGYNKSVTVYGLNHTDFFTIRDQQYNVTLTNLHPDTVYCYKVVATNTEERSESMLRCLRQMRLVSLLYSALVINVLILLNCVDTKTHTQLLVDPLREASFHSLLTTSLSPGLLLSPHNVMESSSAISSPAAQEAASSTAPEPAVPVWPSQDCSHSPTTPVLWVQRQ